MSSPTSTSAKNLMRTIRQVPIASPRASYLAHKAEIDEAVTRTLESGSYIMGPEVEQFEREFASHVGVSDCITAASGTDALILALRGFGIGSGDTVATVSHTAVATVSAIDIVGAHPLLVDVDATHCTMSPEHLERALVGWAGSPVKAVIPVHLYGQPADMTSIVAIARRFNAAVIEDCAQAHGAVWRGRRVGAMGDAGAFGFYPTKNVGAFGDGGALVTSDPDLADRCRMIKQYGWRQRYISEVAGMNTRLDELQAAILRVKLAYTVEDTRRRQEIARRYAKEGANDHIAHPSAATGSEHVFHQYVVQCASRESLKRHMQDANVGFAVLYPVPVHRQPGYAPRVSVGTTGLRSTEALGGRILSIPMYPELEESDIEMVSAALRSFRPGNE